MRVKKWENSYREYQNNMKGINVETSSIAGIFKSTINFNVKEFMKKLKMERMH